jgi:hypothetical protein
MDDRPRGVPHGCRATAKTTGRPCKNNPGPGALVCHVHGGKAPQVKAKAAGRAAEAAARAACEALGVPVETTAEDALQDELNRTHGHVAWFRARIAGLDGDPFTWAEGEPAWWQVYCAEREHLVAVCKAMLAADVQGRLVSVAKETAAQFGQILTAVCDALNLTPQQRALVPAVLPRALRVIDAGPDGDGPDGDGPDGDGAAG